MLQIESLVKIWKLGTQHTCNILNISIFNYDIGFDLWVDLKLSVSFYRCVLTHNLIFSFIYIYICCRSKQETSKINGCWKANSVSLGRHWWEPFFLRKSIVLYRTIRYNCFYLFQVSANSKILRVVSCCKLLPVDN